MKIKQFDSDDLFEAHGPFGKKSPKDIERIKKALEREKNDKGTHRKETPSQREANLKRNYEIAKNADNQERFDEAGMSGLNRAAPATNVSYDKVLDTVTDKWKGQKVQVTEISKGAEKKWVAGANKWRDEQTAKGGGADPKIVAKADKRAERTMKIKQKHDTKESMVTELSVETLKKHKQGVANMDPATTPKYKMVKHHEGGQKAATRIAHMTGDRTNKMYESKLNEFLKSLDK